jgi:hypothetical protein
MYDLYGILLTFIKFSAWTKTGCGQPNIHKSICVGYAIPSSSALVLAFPFA